MSINAHFLYEKIKLNLCSVLICSSSSKKFVLLYLSFKSVRGDLMLTTHHIGFPRCHAGTFSPRKILEISRSVSRDAERSCRRPFGGFASLRSRRQTIQRTLSPFLSPSVHPTPRRYTSTRSIPYAPSIFMGLSTYCQTYWASANGRRHARNSWIFKQVTKQSSFTLAPASGTDTPPGHQAVPYYLIAYWAEMELSYSIQLRVRVGTPGPIYDQGCQQRQSNSNFLSTS